MIQRNPTEGLGLRTGYGHEGTYVQGFYDRLLHIAWIYQNSSNTHTIYFDGQKQFSRSYQLDRQTFPDCIIACCDYIDEFRISDGIARWTQNFTPPTAPYALLEAYDSEEANKQAQYDYFKLQKIRFKHNATGTACIWWVRSVPTSNNTNFKGVKADGTEAGKPANYSEGLVPCFVIG